MKKVRPDLLSILMLAILAASAIVLWSDHIGIETPQQQGHWLVALAFCALLLALVASFDRLGRWSDAARVLRQRLHSQSAAIAGATQAWLSTSSDKQSLPTNGLNAFRRELVQRQGWSSHQPRLL